MNNYFERTEELTAKYMELFGLSWNVYLSVKPQHKMPEGADGYIDINYPYIKAYIDIVEELDPQRLERVVSHEVAHILLAPMADVFYRVVERTPKGERKWLTELFDAAQEQVCELLSRGVTKEYESGQSKVIRGAVDTGGIGEGSEQGGRAEEGPGLSSHDLAGVLRLVRGKRKGARNQA